MLPYVTALLLATAPFAVGDAQFTSPSAGATVAGGSTIDVEWKDSGSSPALSTFQTYSLFLCAGGNDDASFIQLAPIQAQGQLSTGNKASGPIQASLGGPDKNAYFLKIQLNSPQGNVINYSDRFTLSGMTGTFPANVQQGIAGITGTGGPPTVNSVNSNAQAGDPAAGNSVPYAMQTGLTKFAPMQRQPGTKISAKTASMQYPTSAVNIAKTFLPIPKQVTTQTASGTATVSSMENTASPAPMPMDAMQKYLERWRD